jgi:hypothetical protein
MLLNISSPKDSLASIFDAGDDGDEEVEANRMNTKNL